jgi:hypothetical protein
MFVSWGWLGRGHHAGDRLKSALRSMRRSRISQASSAAWRSVGVIGRTFRLAVSSRAIHGWFNPALQCRGQHGITAVISLNLLTLLPALVGMVAADPPPNQVVRRVVVHNEIIMRVPIRPRPAMQINWRAKRGPNCIAARGIAGAMLSGRSSNDFVLRYRRRFRAEFDSDCPALDFYGGFYVQPEDDRLCVRRDVIRSRMGGSCRIERFRRLMPLLNH